MKRITLVIALALTACGQKEPPKPLKPLVTCEGFKDVPHDCISGAPLRGTADPSVTGIPAAADLGKQP